MVQLQFISKILETKDFSIITDNMLDETYFIGYENEFRFIKEHIDEYGNVPDKATFLSKFPEIELVEVAESDIYLVNTIREEFLYNRSVPIIQKMADLMSTDANAAAQYLLSELPNLQPSYSINAIDIISQADNRLLQYNDKKVNKDKWFYTTGFQELDEAFGGGIQSEEELVVLFARPNQGKSWILAKICTHLWQIGRNVGYISPEMSADSIGYRFDTLNQHISNTDLMHGNEIKDYESYIQSLKEKKNKFIVATPIDFNRKITISKIKNFIKQNKLDIIAIDGITYLTDERYKRGDNKTTTLTNLSEDLISLSMELSIPILVVVQSNRSGAMDKETDGTPELESIRDSDGIAMNATKVISIRQTNEGLEIGIKKQRFGPVNQKLLYDWDIDTGTFTSIPVSGRSRDKDSIDKMKEHYKKKDKEDVF